MKKGLRPGFQPSHSRDPESEPSPDEEGIKTIGVRLVRNDGRGPNRALMKKGLRLNELFSFSIMLGPNRALMKKGLRQLDKCMPGCGGLVRTEP